MVQSRLQTLDARSNADAPFDFATFERRRDAEQRRFRAVRRGIAASVAALGMITGVAVLTQAPPLVPAAVFVERSAENTVLPALVDLGQFDRTTGMEEHIAVIDAALSAARATAAPALQLQQLESTRRRLDESLQHVNYAHSLLSL